MKSLKNEIFFQDHRSAEEALDSKPVANGEANNAYELDLLHKESSSNLVTLLQNFFSSSLTLR